MTPRLPITRDDLTVEHGTAEFGPTANVTVKAGPLAGRTFRLRSTENMTEPTGVATSLRKGGGIHLDGGDTDSARVDWRGAFKTFDMEVALDWLVEYVNDVAVRKAVEDATWGVLGDLADTLTAFRDSLEESSRREWRVEWQRACDAFVAARLKVEAHIDAGEASAVSREQDTTNH